jgi:TorA maturation chaperone TorD
MTVTLSSEASLIEAAGRAVLYSLSAYGLALPTPARWERISRDLLPAALALAAPEPLPKLIRDLAAASPRSSDDLRAAHFRLFPPIASQDAPGYETAYRGEDIFRQVEILADIGGFYRAHGLAAGGEEKERPDHIVVELEFCALVSRKEIYALQHLGPAEVEVCQVTRSAFLRDHLGCWGPGFGRRVAAVAGHAFYRTLGQLTAAWIEADLASVGASPVEQADQPLPQDPPEEFGCGPCPTPGTGLL